MKNNNLFLKFKTDFYAILQTYKDNRLIENRILNQINKNMNNLEKGVNDAFARHINLINKVYLNKEKENDDYQAYSTTLNNKLMLKKENINKIVRNQIANLNNKIKVIQDENKDKLEILAKENQIEIDKINNNLEFIDLAYHLNCNNLELDSAKVYKAYEDYLNNRQEDAKDTIVKTNSYYSKRIVLFGDDEIEELESIHKVIRLAQDELSSIDNTYSNAKNELLAKKHALVTKLNNKIKELNLEKSKFIKAEEENNKIKKTDLNKSLNNLNNEYEEKNKEITAKFTEEVNKQSIIANEAKSEYDKDLENLKREYFYNFYTLNNELNEYLTANKETNNDSLRLRIANLKLNKIKINSYHHKIKELKAKHNYELKELESRYNKILISTKKMRNIAEINRDYELELAKIEYETSRDNTTLYNDFLDKQINSNKSSIDNEYEYRIIDEKYKSYANIALIDKEIALLDARNQFEVNDLKIKIANAKAREIQIQDKKNLRIDYYKDVVKKAEKLEIIISNLELDRNEKIKEYNDRIIEIKKQILDIYHELEIKQITIKANYLADYFSLIKKQENLKVSLDRQPFNKEIDLIEAKKHSLLNYEDIYFRKNEALALLNHNRKNFRFDLIILRENGFYIYDCIDQLITFYSQVRALFDKKLKRNDSNYFNLYIAISSLVYRTIKQILKNFNTEETMVIENRIQTETRATSGNEKNELLNAFNRNNALLEDKVLSLNNMLEVFENTKQNNKKKITRILQTIKEKGLASDEFGNNIVELFNTLFAFITIFKRKCHHKHLIKKTRKAQAKLKKRYDKALKHNKMVEKQEYNSSYALIRDANNLLKDFEEHMDALENHYIQTFDIELILKSNDYFDVLFNYVEATKQKYLSVFNVFRTRNEAKYLKSRKTILSTYKKDLTKEIKANKKHNNIINVRINNRIDTINNLIKTNQSDLINLKDEFNNNYKKLNKEAKINIHNANNSLAASDKAYLAILYSITDNISILRENFDKTSINDKLGFEKGLNHVDTKYTTDISNNNVTLRNYKNRLNIDESNIPVTYVRYNKEQKVQNKEDKKNYYLKKHRIENNKRRFRKEYEKQKLTNISITTKKLLKEKHRINNLIKEAN